MSKSIVSIAIGNVTSKAVGLLREVLFAAWFGTGEVAAAFRIAQTAFLLPTHALVGDSLGPGLLPLYRAMRNEGRGDERMLVLVASLYASAFSLVCGALLYLYSHAVVSHLAPGSLQSVAQLAAALLRILSLALPFYVLGYLLGYVEAGHGRFGAIAWRPLVFNVGSIAGAALAVVTRVDHWIAIGLVVGHVLFFGWTIVQLRAIGPLFPSTFGPKVVRNQVSSRFLMNVAPLLALPILAQANVVVERIISSSLGVAVIPSVDYARFISETAVQLIAVPLGIKTMAISDGKGTGSHDRHVRDAAALAMVMAIPVGAYVLQNATPIVAVLFARGSFDQAAVHATGGVLRWFGGSLGATVVGYYLVKVLNAHLRNMRAIGLVAAAVIANMLVNVCCWRWLGVDVVGVGSAAYGVVLLLGGMTVLGMWRSLSPVLVWLIVGWIGCLALWALLPAMSPLRTLIVSGLLYAAIWGSLVLCIPALREAASPLIDRLPRLKRFQLDRRS